MTDLPNISRHARDLPRGFSLTLVLCLVVFTAAGHAAGIMPSQAVEVPMTTSVPMQVDGNAIALRDDLGDAPTSELWSDFGEERWVRNVNHPTVLPVLPSPDIANGAAILVIPGGGFQFVSIDNEGYRIAAPLVAQGYAVFILKYRTMPTPASEVEFSRHMRQVFSGELPHEGFDRAHGEALATADALAAWQLIHERAEAWGIDPERTGVIGFSAGAVTALGLAREASVAHPAFLGYVYGPMSADPLPETLPPLFSALAADDTLYAGQGFDLIEQWQASGGSVQFHYYETGGHGFGSYRRGLASDDWLSDFTRWLDYRGISAE